MATILDKIVEYKRMEVDRIKSSTSVLELKCKSTYKRKTLSLVTKLLQSSDINIIAEYKRASPSKGKINKSESLPQDVVIHYEKSGAAASSILTDQNFFKAKNDDFENARKNVSIPLLRKEFMIDEYQIHEAKAMGADVILLIGNILDKSTASNLTNLAHDLGLEVLYEIHNQTELDNMPHNIDILGINNRDLNTFKVDYAHSIKILNELPETYPVISESGISHPNTIIELYTAGFKGFLIGEAFMKTDNPGSAFSKFITECRQKIKTL